MGFLSTIGRLLSGETISFEKTTHINLAANLLTADKQNYIGEWRGANTFLAVKPDGTIEYEKQTFEGDTTNTNSISGPINGFDGASFTIGVLGSNTRFHVLQPPVQENGRTVMNVNGEQLVKS